MRLNYAHLGYFWAVVRHGTVRRAAQELHVSRPAISAQIHKLERSLGEKLFEKSGRSLRLTEAGKHVYRYAQEIFALGRELTESLELRSEPLDAQFRVGLTDALPKIVAYELLSASLALANPVRLVVVEDAADRLLAQLATHELDLVLSDIPMPSAQPIQMYEHLLGECGVTVFGTAELAARYGSAFPDSLEGAPWILPTRGTALRSALERWFADRNLRPRIAAEIGDSALLKAFGQAGVGLFPAATAVEREVRRQHRVVPVGRIEDVRERFYAISAERRIRHPAVLAVTDLARTALFAAVPTNSGRPGRTRAPKGGAARRVPPARRPRKPAS